MAIEVVMPKWGLTMEQGTIVKWLRQPGDRLAKGEPLVEVDTDKVLTSIESPDSGVLEQVLAGEGDAVPCGQVIAYINKED